MRQYAFYVSLFAKYFTVTISRKVGADMAISANLATRDKMTLIPSFYIYDLFMNG